MGICVSNDENKAYESMRKVASPDTLKERMRMLTKTVTTTKQEPVKVLKMKWNKAVSEKLSKLPCSACRKPIGNERWGLAWIEDPKGNYAMRLCVECGEKAERALKGKG